MLVFLVFTQLRADDVVPPSVVASTPLLASCNAIRQVSSKTCAAPVVHAYYIPRRYLPKLASEVAAVSIDLEFLLFRAGVYPETRVIKWPGYPFNTRMR